MGNAVVATQRDFQPATQHRTMQHRQRRLVAVFDGQGQFLQDRRPGRLAELANIGAGDKGLTCAIEHDHFDLPVLLGRSKGFQQPGAYGVAKGIDRRVVDPDQGHTGLAGHLYG
ncbi:hypothetical protein D3C76_1634710 [compost metagenome]